MPIVRLYALLVALCMIPSVAVAQPFGWSKIAGLSVQENSGATLTNFQVRLVLDTQTLISAGFMQATGDDLRFSSDCAFLTTLPYWIESGINTASTGIWVKVPSLPA